MRATLVSLALVGTVLSSSASAATATIASGGWSSTIASIMQILYPVDPVRVPR
jgi:hypothetical protein